MSGAPAALDPVEFDRRPLQERLRYYAAQLAAERVAGRRMLDTLAEAAVELELLTPPPAPGARR